MKHFLVRVSSERVDEVIVEADSVTWAEHLLQFSKGDYVVASFINWHYWIDVTDDFHNE